MEVRHWPPGPAYTVWDFSASGGELLQDCSGVCACVRVLLLLFYFYFFLYFSLFRNCQATVPLGIAPCLSLYAFPLPFFPGLAPSHAPDNEVWQQGPLALQ